MIDNYGVDNISKLDSVREEKRTNFTCENFKMKAKKTWLEKYGVDNPSKSDDIKLKKQENDYLQEIFYKGSSKKGIY